MKNPNDDAPIKLCFLVYAKALAIIALGSFFNTSLASITQINNPALCPSPCWEISGEIIKSDLEGLAKAAELISTAKNPPTFRLNSKGGDVSVAIEIGRQLRRSYATAVVWDNGGCYSSCVFIYAGATQRIAGDSSIWIHRPYSSSSEIRDYQTIQNEQRALAKLAKEYLEEVNVSPSLYDAMISVPPEKVKNLSPAERDSYGLIKIDPVQQELWDTNEAALRNIPKVELMRRKAQSDTICAAYYEHGARTSNFDNYFKCVENVLSGSEKGTDLF